MLTQALKIDGDEEDTQVLSLRDIPAPREKVPYIGDYELLEVIAQGGMGVVYRARQCSLNRLVALKMLLGGAHASEAFKRRFRQEAQTAARLQHPNIVPIYEVGEHEGQPYYSMEFVPGQDLAHLCGEHPPSAEQAAEQLRTVAEAVHAAHLQGVLHRDLKPSNILIGEDGRPRVTDFGLARQINTESSLTASGEMLGTPGYLPPEQVSMKQAQVGPHSDVYALGAVLYYLLTSRPPFLGNTLADSLQQVLNAEPVLPARLNPSVPQDLQTICLKCLAKEPGQRYASAKALADDLGRFLRGEPIAARPANAAQRLVRWSGRQPVLASLTATVVFTVLLGLGVSLWLWAEVRSAKAEIHRLRQEARQDRVLAAAARQEAIQSAQAAELARKMADYWAEERTKARQTLESTMDKARQAPAGSSLSNTLGGVSSPWLLYSNLAQRAVEVADVAARRWAETLAAATVKAQAANDQARVAEERAAAKASALDLALRGRGTGRDAAQDGLESETNHVPTSDGAAIAAANQMFTASPTQLLAMGSALLGSEALTWATDYTEARLRAAAALGQLEAAPLGEGIKARTRPLPTLWVADTHGTAVDQWSPGIGAGLADMLVTELSSVGKFQILRPAKPHEVGGETNLVQAGYVTNAAGSEMDGWVGSDYMLVSSVTRFGSSRQAVNLGGFVPFSGGSLGVKTTTSDVRIDWRIVDVYTRKVIKIGSVTASQKGTGFNLAGAGNQSGGVSFHNAEFLNSALGKATLKALTNLVQDLAALNLPESGRQASQKRKQALEQAAAQTAAAAARATPGAVLAIVDDKTLVVSLGSRLGFKNGDKLKLYRPVLVKNEQGAVVFTDQELAGEVTLDRVQEDKSRAAYSGGAAVEVGWVVRSETL